MDAGECRCERRPADGSTFSWVSAPSLFDRRCLMCRSSPATQIEHSGGAMMVPRGIDSVGSAGRVLHLRSGCHCGGGYCVGLERG